MLKECTLEKKTFKPTITISTITITSLTFIVLLYVLVIYDNKSVPPVEPPAFKIRPKPSPIVIPPYIDANNLSLVKGWNFSNKSIKVESNIVPAIDFINISLPILKNANINNGIFSTRIVTPSGTFNK